MRTAARLYAAVVVGLIACTALVGVFWRDVAASRGGEPGAPSAAAGASLTGPAALLDAELNWQRSLLRRELRLPSAKRVGLPGPRLRGVFVRKAAVVRKIKRHKLAVLNNSTLSSEEKRARLRELDVKLGHMESLESLGSEVLRIFEGSLNETSSAAVDTRAQLSNLIYQLQSVSLKAQADINNFERERKEMEKEASIRARKRLLTASDGVTDGFAPGRTTLTSELVSDMLDEVSSQADMLEDGMRDNVFATQQGKKGSSVETVIKVTEDEDEQELEASRLSDRELDAKTKVGTLMVLIDPDDNQYVLTKPSDLTVHYDDIKFLHDLICILLLSFVCGYICSLLNLPPFFGYMIAGCVLGPPGFNTIRAVVQVEALAQLGVMLIIFVLGIEFSFELISRIWVVAIGGMMSILFVTVSLFCILSAAMGQATGEAIFVGACVSLSSTAVVVKSVKSDSLDIMYGILVTQDLLLGLILAILPTLEESGNGAIWAAGSLVFSLVSITVLILGILRVPIAEFLKQVKKSGQHEVFLLAVLFVCLLTLKLTELNGLGMELGCFLAGMVISSSSSPVSQAALTAVEPVRDMFLCLFFSAIGMHVYPSFLVREMFLVLTLAAGAIGFKWAVTTAVLMAFRLDLTRASAVGLGLAQISEFAFVLCSRAKAMRIISREVYYLLLATTSLSLLATPVLLRTVFRPVDAGPYPPAAPRPPTPLDAVKAEPSPGSACAELPQQLGDALARAREQFAGFLGWPPAAYLKRKWGGFRRRHAAAVAAVGGGGGGLLRAPSRLEDALLEPPNNAARVG